METTNLILLVLLVLALSQVLMVAFFVISRQQRPARKDATSEKDWDLIHAAIKKSQAIVGEAELEAIKETAVSRQQTETHEQEILEITKQEMVKAGEAYKKELASQTELIKRLSEEETKKTVSEFRGQLEKNMHEIQDGFAKELAIYKTQKEKKLDQNAEEIIDRAVELYLGKKLSRAEQMQLIFEALEKAKAENEFS